MTVQPTRMMIRSPRLPVELIEHTISFLWDDPSTLCKCTLTCKALLPFSRKTLFTHVFLLSRISFEALRERARESELVRSYLTRTKALYVDETAWPWHAHWASFFQDLAIAGSGLHPLFASTVTPRTDHDLTPGLSSEASSFGAYMTNLQFVQLKGMHWDVLPPEPAQGFSSFVTVTTLELTGCRFRNLVHLERLVCAFPALERLRLEGSSWRTWYDERVPMPFNTAADANFHSHHGATVGLESGFGAEGEHQTLSGPRLVELAVKTSESCDDFLEWIARTQSRDSIRMLSLHSSKCDLFSCTRDNNGTGSSSPARRLVRTLQASLEELSVVLPDCLSSGHQGERASS